MSKGLQQTPEVTLSVDGEEITAPAGATAAAAMLGAGKRAWRTTRKDGKPRGQFCGIGACWDCLVSVDGSQVQRVCLLPVEDGMTISTQDPEVAAAPTEHEPHEPAEEALATAEIAITVGPEPEPEPEPDTARSEDEEGPR